MAAKVIKGSGGGSSDGTDVGSIDPDSGFGEIRKKPMVVTAKTFEAGNDAKKIVGDAESKAQAIVADAEAQAADIIAKAQAEAEQMKATAHDNGFKEGSDQAASQYTQMIAEHSKRMEQKEGEVANQIRQLSLAIAKKIIGKELEINPSAIVEMAKKHLQSIRQRREVYLRVSPADLERLREHKRELIDQLGRAKEIEIRADEALSPGSIMIETEAGSIDARIETQMAVIERVLMGKVGPV